MVAGAPNQPSPRISLPGGFLRSVTTLSGGALLAAMVPMASAPITGRIYTPEEFGLFGAYGIVSSVLSVIATLQYASAVLPPKSDDDARQVVGLCVGLSIAQFFIGTAAVATLRQPLLTMMNAEPLGSLLLVAPAHAAVGGTGLALSTWANRNGAYRVLSLSRVLSVVAIAASSIWFGSRGVGVAGLILSALIGNLVGAACYVAAFPRGWATVSWARVRAAAVINRRFAIYTAPTTLINTFTAQLPTVMMAAMFGPTVLGTYSRAVQILTLPATFVGAAVGEWFRRQASIAYGERGECASVFRRTFGILVALALPGFGLLFVIAPDFFAFYLGEQWRASGDMARLIFPVYLLAFLNGPLSFVVFLAKAHAFDLRMTIVLNVLMTASCTAAYLYAGRLEAVLLAFTVTYSLVYVYMLTMNWRFANNRSAHRNEV